MTDRDAFWFVAGLVAAWAGDVATEWWLKRKRARELGRMGRVIRVDPRRWGS